MIQVMDHERKAEIVQRVIEVSHLTDLVRCWHLDKKSKLIEMMTTFLRPLFTLEIINVMMLIEQALTIASACCKATGCQVKLTSPIIEYDLERCVRLSKNPKSALSTIRNTIKKQISPGECNSGTEKPIFGMNNLREHARGFFKKSDITQIEHLSDKSPCKPAIK